jgi:hypothetical protein
MICAFFEKGDLEGDTSFFKLFMYFDAFLTLAQLKKLNCTDWPREMNRLQPVMFDRSNWQMKTVLSLRLVALPIEEHIQISHLCSPTVFVR